MGRGCGAHFPPLAFNVLAGKEGAVGGPDAVARPIRPKARKFAAEVFLSAQQGFFLRWQGAQCLPEATFAFGHAAQGGQSLQQGIIDLKFVTPLAQPGEFFHLRGPLPLAALAGLLRAGKAFPAVFGKGGAYGVKTLKASARHAPFVPL